MVSTPASPSTTPTNLRAVAGSWRVTAQVMRKMKIGESELRIVVSLASMMREAHATSTHGTTTFSIPCDRNQSPSRAACHQVLRRGPRRASSTRPPQGARSVATQSGRDRLDRDLDEGKLAPQRRASRQTSANDFRR